MNLAVLRRKHQKKCKRRHYSRCSKCGHRATCRMRAIPDALIRQLGNLAPHLIHLWTRCEDVPIKECVNGHVHVLLHSKVKKQYRNWSGGGMADAYGDNGV